MSISRPDKIEILLSFKVRLRDNITAKANNSSSKHIGQVGRFLERILIEPKHSIKLFLNRQEKLKEAEQFTEAFSVWKNFHKKTAIPS